ncbi:trypsin-6-like [Chrysoperla carnea]|uniref:trypsin-6-like n=1 Tax=Chrysoperla carnea TaxID=189513 RepID=UPI001D060E99|nr:trypsin-6-like [Chrysoperla carnea]
MKLNKPVVLNDQVAIAEIPNQNEETKAGEIGLLTGWGLYGSGSPISKRLRKVNQTVVDIKECKKVHELPILESNICAGDPEGGKGQCNADSGGPLFVNGKVVGIVSWSVKPCGIKGFPGVFTRVASYREWILEHTGV